LLPSEIDSGDIPLENRKYHTENLEEAIRNWIEFFPDPNANYPFDSKGNYQNNLRKCKEHILFPDLINHLPEMHYNVLRRWNKYEEDLFKLHRMKIDQLSYVKTEIGRCFTFRLIFIPDLEYGISDYECNLLHKIIYDLIIDMSGRVSGQ
jgi:hypothetical protein